MSDDKDHTSARSRESRRRRRASLVVALLIAGAAIVVGLIAWSVWGPPESGAEFGDLVGGIGGAAALLLMIIAIFIQSDELRLSREELEDTRAEVQAQTSQLAEQAAATKALVAVTQSQNELLGRQLEASQYPIIELRADTSPNLVTYALVNHGRGAAVVRSVRLVFESPPDSYGEIKKSDWEGIAPNLVGAAFDGAGFSGVKLEVNTDVQIGFVLRASEVIRWFSFSEAGNIEKWMSQQGDDELHRWSLTVTVGSLNDPSDVTEHQVRLDQVALAWASMLVIEVFKGNAQMPHIPPTPGEEEA